MSLTTGSCSHYRYLPVSIMYSVLCTLITKDCSTELPSQELLARAPCHDPTLSKPSKEKNENTESIINKKMMMMMIMMMIKLASYRRSQKGTIPKPRKEKNENKDSIYN
jgi:hypothetical protein